jgi:hypothetical protein
MQTRRQKEERLQAVPNGADVNPIATTSTTVMCAGAQGAAPLDGVVPRPTADATDLTPSDAREVGDTDGAPSLADATDLAPRDAGAIGATDGAPSLAAATDLAPCDGSAIASHTRVYSRSELLDIAGVSPSAFAALRFGAVKPCACARLAASCPHAFQATLALLRDSPFASRPAQVRPPPDLEALPPRTAASLPVTGGTKGQRALRNV